MGEAKIIPIKNLFQNQLSNYLLQLGGLERRERFYQEAINSLHKTMQSKTISQEEYNLVEGIVKELWDLQYQTRDKKSDLNIRRIQTRYILETRLNQTQHLNYVGGRK